MFSDGEKILVASCVEFRHSLLMKNDTEAMRAIAKAAKGLAAAIEAVAGEPRALKIAKTRSAGTQRHPAYQAILDAGLTPDDAAAVCGTTRDVLKQCWATGKQFRRIRQEWREALADQGVPPHIWPNCGCGL